MPLFETKAPGIMALLIKDFDLDVEGSGAILGDLGEECGGFELLQEQHPIAGGAGGYGWPQWTGPRRTEFFTYCTRNKLDPASDKANYGWLFVELKGAYARAIAAIKAATGLESKVKAFMDTYEMPNAAYAHLDVRVAYAKRAIAAYAAAQAAPVAPAPANPPPPPAPVPSRQPDDPGTAATPPAPGFWATVFNLVAAIAGLFKGK